MAEEPSDPNIVARLNKIPPFENEQPETPVEETPVEEVPAETTPEPAPEPAKEETEDERKKRTTEEFEKLKQHNAELKKQLEDQKIPKKNALEALFPDNSPSPTTNVLPTTQEFPKLTPKEIKDTFAGLTDDQGYVDTGLLKETLVDLQKAKDEAIKRATEAENKVKDVSRRQDEFERKQIMKDVHSIYPKLNPENANSDDPDKKFDERFATLFQDRIMGQWARVGTSDPMAVAGDISAILYPAMTKADKEKAEKAELAKRNINATSVKPASTVETYKDKDELARATRAGSHNALMERLNRINQ
jgi:hypothetical protein